MPKSPVPHLEYEQKLWHKGLTHVVGVDEVGRGCLAGPVVVGAVVFAPDHKRIYGIRDSKLLKAKTRVQLAEKIKKRARCYGIGVGSVELINTQGIMHALKVAVQSALDQLEACHHLLMDGQHLDLLPSRHTFTSDFIIKGDQHSYSIAAASILAKVYRDEYMQKLANNYPGYGWQTNVGYGTKEHQAGLRQRGVCPHHRLSFVSSFLQ